MTIMSGIARSISGKELHYYKGILDNFIFREIEDQYNNTLTNFIDHCGYLSHHNLSSYSLNKLKDDIYNIYLIYMATLIQIKEHFDSEYETSTKYFFKGLFDIEIHECVNAILIKTFISEYHKRLEDLYDYYKMSLKSEYKSYQNKSEYLN